MRWDKFILEVAHKVEEYLKGLAVGPELIEKFKNSRNWEEWKEALSHHSPILFEEITELLFKHLYYNRVPSPQQSLFVGDNRLIRSEAPNGMGAEWGNTKMVIFLKPDPPLKEGGVLIEMTREFDQPTEGILCRTKMISDENGKQVWVSQLGLTHEAMEALYRMLHYNFQSVPMVLGKFLSDEGIRELARRAPKGLNDENLEYMMSKFYFDNETQKELFLNTYKNIEDGNSNISQN